MILYQGSYCLLEKPHTSFLRDDLDFEKGFYLTKIREQAICWTNRNLKRLKFFKPNHQICIVNQEIIDKYLKYEGSKEV